MRILYFIFINNYYYISDGYNQLTTNTYPHNSLTTKNKISFNTPPQDGLYMSKIPILDNNRNKTHETRGFVKMSASYLEV